MSETILFKLKNHDSSRDNVDITAVTKRRFDKLKQNDREEAEEVESAGNKRKVGGVIRIGGIRQNELYSLKKME
jgi:ADP-ribosylglycohydrolase